MQRTLGADAEAKQTIAAARMEVRIIGRGGGEGDCWDEGRGERKGRGGGGTQI